MRMNGGFIFLSGQGPPVSCNTVSQYLCIKAYFIDSQHLGPALLSPVVTYNHYDNHYDART